MRGTLILKNSLVLRNYEQTTLIDGSKQTKKKNRLPSLLLNVQVFTGNSLRSFFFSIITAILFYRRSTVVFLPRDRISTFFFFNSETRRIVRAASTSLAKFNPSSESKFDRGLVRQRTARRTYSFGTSATLFSVITVSDRRQSVRQCG